MRFLLYLVLIAPLAIATTAVASDAPSETVSTFGPVSVGGPLPTFAGYDGDGVFVRSKEYVEAAKSGGLVISFFATWCGPCRAGMPVIQRAVTQRTGWKALFIDVGEDPAKVTSFLASIGNTQAVVYDQNGLISKRFGVADSLPKTFVVGPDGTVRAIFVSEGADFDARLAEVLAAVQPPSGSP